MAKAPIVEQPPKQEVGPAAPAEESKGPAKTIEELGIGPGDPYPTGSPSKDSANVPKEG